MSFVCEACGLDFSAEYERMLPERLGNMNTKWENAFSQQEVAVIDVSVGELLKDLGYL